MFNRRGEVTKSKHSKVPQP